MYLDKPGINSGLWLIHNAVISVNINKVKMNIQSGFQIDTPNIFVPWDINEEDLKSLFESQKLNYVTSGYYTISCNSLNGLHCKIGFHFKPGINGLLKEFEFFMDSEVNMKKTFKDFQSHFEGEFGKPDKATNRYPEFPGFEWIIGEVQIIHEVHDRFGPEEHMRIKKLS